MQTKQVRNAFTYLTAANQYFNFFGPEQEFERRFISDYTETFTKSVELLGYGFIEKKVGIQIDELL